MDRHNVLIPDELWRRAEKAARLQSVHEDQQVSVSELIRRALEEEVQRIEDREGVSEPQ